MSSHVSCHWTTSPVVAILDAAIIVFDVCFQQILIHVLHRAGPHCTCLKCCYSSYSCFSLFLVVLLVFSFVLLTFLLFLLLLLLRLYICLSVIYAFSLHSELISLSCCSYVQYKTLWVGGTVASHWYTYLTWWLIL